MIQTFNFKIVIGLYTIWEEYDHFRQYVDDDVQQCHFTHKYENKLNDNEYR